MPLQPGLEGSKGCGKGAEELGELSDPGQGGGRIREGCHQEDIEPDSPQQDSSYISAVTTPAALYLLSDLHADARPEDREFPASK